MDKEIFYDNNVQDTINRGRFAYGEKHGRAILTENDVKNILIELWEGNVFCGDIAEKYNVHSSTINLISRGEKSITN